MNRVLIILAGMLFAASPAFAHAFLAHASPSAGSEMRAAPPAVTIKFTEAVEPRFSTIEVRDAAGKRVDAGDLHTVGGAETISIGIPGLPPGIYWVIWHATSVDTHKTEGRYTFTVLP
jgi:methionine-rich copper-binding protein CopC